MNLIMKFQILKGESRSWNDLSFEFSFEASTPLHEEEVPTTSPDLDDVIERSGRLNLEENVATPPADQPGPSKKIPKWATKTLESVVLDEVGKTGTRNSTSQDDRGETNNSGDDIDVSFDCELNLSANFEPTSFKKATACDERNEYDALMKKGT